MPPFEQRNRRRLEAPLQPLDAAERDHFHPLRVVAGIPALIDGVVWGSLVPVDSKHLRDI